MKNSKSKVLMTSVIMLVVAVMALTTATYAWFISSTEAKVSTITMNAATAEGIRFSVDGENWKNTLTVGTTEGADIIINAPTQADGQTAWLPTSTNFEDSDQDQDTVWDFYYVNSYKEDGTVTIAQDTANYIAFSFYIQLDGESAGANGLWLHKLDGTIPTLSCDGPEGTSLLNCLRVAFIVNETPETINSKAAVDTTGTRVVWQPGGDVEEYYPLKTTSNGVQLGTNSIIGNTNTDVVGAATGVAEGAKHQGDEYFTESPAFPFTPDGNGTTPAQYKVTIVIWIEGQDEDCTNAVASQSITANLVFTFIDPANNG